MALSILLALVYAVWLLFLFSGLGALLLRPLRSSIDSAFLFAAFSSALGFGMLAAAVTLLCFVQFAHAPVIIALLLLATPFAAFGIAPHIRSGTLYVSTHLRESWTQQPLLLSAVLVMMAGYFCRGLLPPWEFDALMYHLPAARFYLEHGGFYNITFNAQTDFPMLVEMIDLVCLALDSDIAIKTVSALLGICAALLAGYTARKRLSLSLRDTLLSMLLFLTLTNNIAVIASPDVDIPLAIWTVLALYAADVYCRSNHRGLLLLSIILCGMAASSKVFGFLAVPAVLAVCALHRIPAAAWRRLTLESLAISLGSFALVLPWYLKSLVHKGTIFSIAHTAMEGQGLANPLGIAGLAGPLWYIVDIPLRLVAAPYTFSLFLSQHQGDTFGPLFLATLPFLLLLRLPRRYLPLAAGAAAWFAGVLFMEMCFIQGGSSIRYSIPVLVLIAALPVYVAANIPSVAIRRLLYSMILCMAALGMLLFVKRYHADWKALVCNSSRGEYYRAVLPEYPIIDQINALPGNRLVMPLYNYDDYLITHPFETASRTFNTAAEMDAYFSARNIGWIFANNTLDTAENARAYPQYPRKRIIAAANGFYLYEIGEIPSR